MVGASSHYEPPFTPTREIVSLAAAASSAIQELQSSSLHPADLTLRRIQQIKTIHGTLAIEGNTLDPVAITTILNGKHVMAPPREILEVKNALAVYDDFDSFTPNHEPDMLRAHATLMSGLADDAGRYRTGQVGVFSGQQVIHMAPPAARVPHLMGDLFEWLATTTELPLITSCLFHYEFEFIHPFSDGNGRIGRLWQRVIAAKWQPALAHLPVESMVHAQQSDYYDAIALSTKQTDCAPFVHFMLSMILQTAKEQLSTHNPSVKLG